MAVIPFQLDANARKPLSQQAVDGFRTAIKEGVYRDGESLPTLRELAEAWHVSIKVPGQAYSRLANEGYIVLHPGRGAFARRSGVRVWNGNVLFVSVGFQGGFFLPHFLQALRMGIEEANLRFYTAVVPTPMNGDGPDFKSLVSYLSQPYDLVILMSDSPRLRNIVRRSTTRSLVVGRVSKDKSKPEIMISANAAERAFVDDCRRSGVKKVCVMTCAFTKPAVADLLKAAGIRVEVARINVSSEIWIFEGIQRMAHDYWADRLNNHRPFPDLIYFSDDNLALGSLIAFAEKGVRIPDDVKVVTLANRGSALPFDCDLARIEADPIRFGRETARRALAGIQSKKPIADYACEFSYIRGKSFPN